MATKKVKSFVCKACGRPSEKIGVASICRQILHIDSDNWTDLSVDETLYGFCLECATPISVAQFKKLTGLQVEPDIRAILTELVNSAETEGCDGCATVSLETLNQARVALGFKTPVRRI